MQLKFILPVTTMACAILFSSCANSKLTTEEKKPEVVATADADGYLIGQHMINPETGKPVKDHYISPFKPYNPIVAKGFKSGQLAGDPSTIQINPETGKPDKSTMKIFKLP